MGKIPHMVDFEGKREAKSGWWVILHQIIFVSTMKDIGAKLILDILSLTSQGKKLKIFTSLPLTHQEERTGC